MENRNLIVRRVLMVLLVPPLTVGLAVRYLIQACKFAALVWWHILLDTKQYWSEWFDACRDLWRGDR